MNPGNVPKIGPHLPPETTSTLLVTKKSPAIIHQGQAVGNIFGPTTTTQPIVTQPQAVRTPTETPQAQQTSIPGLSGAEIQVQSDGWSVSQSSDGGQSPGSTTPQQEPQAANAPPPVPNVDNMDSQQKDTGLNGGQASGEQISGGQTSGGQAGSGQPSVGSESPAPGGQVPAGQGSGTQASSDGRSDQTTSNGGSFPPGSRESSSALAQPDYSTPKQSASSQTVSEQSSSRGSSTSFHNENPGTVSSPPSGNRPPSGGTFGNDGKSVNENGSPQGSTDPLPNQYVPEIVTANGVHISIVPSAVIVGSQTINAGSPPTTFVVQGQIIAVQPSRILAAGATIPIEAAITPPPATSVDIGNVLVVMQPDNLLIGPQSFSHGSSAGTAIYNGQTYSWDADQLVGPGTTVAFPSAGTVPAPRITAAGQVFSVFPSHLKAAGLTLALPNTPEASAFVYKGQTFSINPSQLIAPDRSITTLSPGKPTPFVYGGNTFSVDASQFIAASTTIPLSAGSGVVTYKNEEIIVRPSQIAGPSITIALSAEPQAGVTATPSAITAGGVTFSLGPSAAVIGPSTYLFLPGQAPTTITSEGRKLGVGPKGVQIGTVNVPVPIESPNYSVVTEGGLTLSLAPTKLVLSGHTEDIRSGMSPIKTVIDGQTISIGPHGVGLGSTTIPLPTPKPSYQVVMEGDLTFSVAPSEAVIKGSTFAIGPDVPATMVMEGQTFSIGPHGIHFPGTTVDLPIVTSEYEPAVVTADGFKLSVGPTNAIIGSSDYPIGNGAHAQTIVVGSETVRLGAGGVMLPSTTIPPEQTPSAITANGLTFSADSSQALINGTAYQIGTEAMAMTVVAGSQTIELGTNGIVLPSTTIGPWGNATNSDASSVPGTDGALGAAPPTGLPGTGSSNWNGGPQHGAGTSLSPSDRLLSSIIISALMLALLLIS